MITSAPVTTLRRTADHAFDPLAFLEPGVEDLLSGVVRVDRRDGRSIVLRLDTHAVGLRAHAFRGKLESAAMMDLSEARHPDAPVARLHARNDSEREDRPTGLGIGHAAANDQPASQCEHVLVLGWFHLHDRNGIAWFVGRHQKGVARRFVPAKPALASVATHHSSVECPLQWRWADDCAGDRMAVAIDDPSANRVAWAQAQLDGCEARLNLQGLHFGAVSRGLGCHDGIPRQAVTNVKPAERISLDRRAVWLIVSQPNDRAGNRTTGVIKDAAVDGDSAA